MMKIRHTSIGLCILLASCAGVGEARPGGTPEPQDPSEAVLALIAEKDGPVATLSYAGESQDGQPGSYCWTSGKAGMCADSAGYPRPESFLEIPRGTILTVSGEGTEVSVSLSDPPKEGELGPAGSSDQVIGKGQPTGTLDAEPGLYLLDVFSSFEQGDGSFAFGIEIVAN